MTVAPVGLFFKSVVICRNHIASCAALASAMYSASAVDNATHVCFLLLQLSAAPLSWNRYPEVDLRSSRSPPQSASEEPMLLVCLSLVYQVRVPLRYLNICFTAIQCWCVGFAEYFATVLTANVMSGLVAVDKERRRPTANWYLC